MKAKILIIETDQELLDLIKARTKGFEFIIASDYEEGLRVFKENMNELHCIMVNVILSDSSGIRLIEAIKEIKNVYAVIYTHRISTTGKEYRESKADTFVTGTDRKNLVSNISRNFTIMTSEILIEIANDDKQKTVNKFTIPSKKEQQLVDIFIKHGQNYFEDMVDCKLAIKTNFNKELKFDFSYAMDTPGTFLIESDDEKAYSGSILIRFTEETYRRIAEVAFDEKIEDLNDDHHSFGKEFANIIIGLAKQDLLPLGYKLDKSVPDLYSGKGHELTWVRGIKIFPVFLECTYGIFCFELRLDEVFH